ncbi:MAG: MFS transporter [Acidobacteria bacterium]|nr:MFS transporter [Acidobacteriota bacterium]
MLQLLEDKKLKAWALYDFANSSYVLIYQAFLLPVYFSSVLVGFGFDKGSWGLANGVSTLIGLLFAVVTGHYSDKRDRLKTFRTLIFLSAIGMGLIALFVAILPPFVFYLYLITNAFFIASLSLSDSLLTFIAEKGNTSEYSGFAWGLGYLGGIVCLVGVMLIQWFVGSEYSPFTFLFVGVFYLGVSYHAVRELTNFNELFETSKTEKESSASPAKDSKAPTLSSFNRVLLLVGYWLISETITVIILFFSIFAAQELLLETSTIGMILLGVQAIGICTTWFGGRLADRYGTSNLLGATLVGWIIVILLLVYVPTVPGLIVITILTGCIIGNSQSFLRSQFAQIVKKYEAGFQFGLFSVSSQAAIVVGPIFHGYFSDALGSQKIPLLISISFLIIGFSFTKYVLRRIQAET